MKKKLAILSASALLVMGFAGCSAAEKEAQQALNKSVLDAVNSSATVSAITDVKLDSFEFLAADVAREAGVDLVDVNGVAEVSGIEKKAYVSLQYEVEDVFAGIDSSKADQVINKLNEIVQTYEISDFDCVLATKIDSVNKAMGKVFESPVDGFKHSNSLTYSVKGLSFNMEEGYYSFETMSNVRYSKSEPSVQMMYRLGPNGKYSWQPVSTIKTYEEKFNEGHKVFVKASAEEMAQMQQDSSLAMDRFVELVNNNQKDRYTVSTTNIQAEKSFNDGAEYSL